MKKLLIATAVLSALTLSGCATKPVHVTPSPMSGSKADGTVTMGYMFNVGPFFGPTIPDWAAAKKLADKKCVVWGYSHSERFGDFINKKCQQTQPNALTGMSECVEYLATVSYQCID